MIKYYISNKETQFLFPTEQGAEHLVQYLDTYLEALHLIYCGSTQSSILSWFQLEF